MYGAYCNDPGEDFLQYGYSFSLIMILGSLKYDTRAYLDTTGTVFMSFIVS